ncbi:hypothetical protein JKF63_00409 [Porcisia hertigi]|uniref:Uncharacterized protein n=1 Tax=Porcisia hertigi TaxID=2761500 RepID=A0A836HD26_9TRYP|nr:hypothetical protein JKF63_00409 [Porcisia hertigi]
MTSRERATQARHVALLASDASVLNRCGQEEVHLKHHLARATAAFALNVKRNQAIADREERSRETRLRAQFEELLSGTSGLEVPSVVKSPSTPGLTDAAKRGRSPAEAAPDPFKTHPTPSTGAVVAVSPGLKSTDATAAGVSTPSATFPPYSLGFPDAYKLSGFKSPIHWASVAYDETFLTAYGPRQVRDRALGQVLTDAEGRPTTREAYPHRFMTAVACYLLNEVLCADAMVSQLWQEKLRQPIFDSVFSSQSIAMGREQSRLRCGHDAGNAAVADATLRTAIESDLRFPLAPEALSATAAPFPRRANTYTTRGEFASLRLWTEEVALQRQERVSICKSVSSLQHAMSRRQVAVDFVQRRVQKAESRAVFVVWRTHTQQRRAYRDAMERFLMGRHLRHQKETTFLRWRGFVLRVKVHALERRLGDIEDSRDRVASEHAAALRRLHENLTKERSRHLQESFERETLQAQILDNHSVELEALRTTLHMERERTAESRRWMARWERVAKTFRPAKPCPPVPRPIWTIACALLKSEEAFAAMVVKHGGDHERLLQAPNSMVLEARQRMEELLLVWVNAIMQESPQASTWIHVNAFKYGYSSQSQKLSSSKMASSQLAAKNASADGTVCEFNIYTFMCLVRELRRRYAEAGLMTKAVFWGRSDGTNVTDCYQELTHLFAVQACGGLYPPLLAHCLSSPLWFTPEGVFAGSTFQQNGTARQLRHQHTVSMWLLASLFVGHIRIMWVASLSDRRVPPGRSPMMDTETLGCKHEAEMMRLTQLSFPIQNSTPGAGQAAAPRGTRVVSKNTVLSKSQTSVSLGPSFSTSAAQKDSTAFVAAEVSKDPATTATEMTLLEMLRARHRAMRDSTRKNSISSDSSSTLVRNELLGLGEDSLADIEAYLGMAPSQVHSLRGEGGSSGSEDGDDEEDRWINRLFRNILEVEEAEAEQRRTMRLRSKEAREHAAGDGCAKSETSTSAIALSDSEECERVSVGKSAARTEAAAEAYTYTTAHGDLSKKTVFLTEDQLRLLRSLPSRSFGFDTPRDVAIEPHEAGSRGEKPSTGNPLNAPSSLYSFLLNSLDDMEARQQWCGLARVVTSLVVRFHLLDNSEDAARWAALQAQARGEGEESRKTKSSQRSPLRRSRSPTPPGTARLPPVSVGDNLKKKAASTARQSVAGMANSRSGGRVAAPLETAEVHASAASSADLLLTDEDGHSGEGADRGVKGDKMSSVGRLAKVTAAAASISCPPTTGGARATGVNAHGANAHVPPKVQVTKQHVAHVRTSIPEAASSIESCKKTQEPSKGVPEEFPRALTFSNAAVSEAHPHAPILSRLASSSIPSTFATPASNRVGQEKSLRVGQLTTATPPSMTASPGRSENVSSWPVPSSSGEYRPSFPDRSTLPTANRGSAPTGNCNSSKQDAPRLLTKPPTLLAPAPPMESGRIFREASSEQSKSLSPLVLHATHLRQSPSSIRPKDYFLMDT